MCLSCNNLTSVNSLSSFSKLEEVWIWNNPLLTSLTGLENHHSLKRLLAPNCGFSDLTGIEGCNLLEYLVANGNKNMTSLDGLENINLEILYCMNCSSLTDISALATMDNEKNVKHTNISRVYFINCTNLEDVSYLGKLISIRFLFLKGCYAVDTEEYSNYDYWIEIDDVVALCGNNCLLPDICNDWLSSSNVRDFAVTSVEDSLEDDSKKMENLRGKTNVTRLSLKNNASLSNGYLNGILATMTGMEYLQLYGCSGLTTITFVTSMPNLKELDLRGTGVTNLTPLDSMIRDATTVNLKTVLIDNIETDMKTIQNLMQKVYQNSNDGSSWVNSNYLICRGVVLIGEGFDFTGCTEVTKYTFSNGLNTGTIDLRGCTNLTSFSAIGSTCKYILPSSVTNYYRRGGAVGDDLSNMVGPLSVQTFETIGGLAESLATCSENLEILSITSQRYRSADLSYLYSLPEKVAKTIQELYHAHYSTYGRTTGISGIERLTGLTSLSLISVELNNLSLLSNLVNLNSLYISSSLVDDWSTLPLAFTFTNTETNKEQINYLTSLRITNSGLNTMSFLNSQNGLTTLDLSSNSLSSISGLSYCKSLKTLGLNVNSIPDISGLMDILTIDEEKTTDEENPVYKTTLTSLKLDNNPIGNQSIYEYDNIDMINLLKKSGVKTITTTGITFSN
ncbi:MAG: leucine-rich repeat domain-containing protein [Clostridia bacterium]|nr:leucine-rich repeat domain-containing protein [Clostridia bacterium]